jgi:hypothetical protein
MDVRLAYGTGGLDVVLPETTLIVEPTDRAADPDAHAALVRAVRRPVVGPPLRAIAQRGPLMVRQPSSISTSRSSSSWSSKRKSVR